MVYGIWLSADGLTSQQARQEVLANNLAQVDTPGFKTDRVAFGERLNEFLLRGDPTARHSRLEGATGGLFPTTVYTDFAQGRMQPTGNKLDIALQGPGFLAVQTEEGVRYTRDGRMTLDESGALVHVASGGLMVDEQHRPIVVDPRRRNAIQIDAAGRIRQGEANVGGLGIFDFDDAQALEKCGENLYAAGAARRLPARVDVRQGMLEASGVDPTLALTDMIAATRAYELGASMIRMQDESLARVVNDVGRIA